MKKRKIDFIDFLILIIALLILFAILSVVLVVAFPEAAKGTANNLRTKLTPYLTKPAKFIAAVSRRGEAGYHYRIEPLVKAVSGRKKAPKQPAAPPRQGVDFSGCLKCHTDLFDRPGSNHIYIDHRIHRSQDLRCGDCHSGGHQNLTNKKSPGKTAGVAESVCLRCHKRDKQAGNCKRCHMPGSLLQAVDKAKTKKFFAQRTVNKKVIVPVGFEHPVGDRSKPCRQCHNYPDFCTRCHAMKSPNIVSAPHDSNWIPTHGMRILRGELTTKGCWECHNSNLCSAACHPNPGRQRGIGPKWPLPHLELK